MSGRDDRRAAFLDGVACFRNRAHPTARERWEPLWRDEPNAERRALLQALILLASALHRAFDERAPGTVNRLLADARARLDEVTEACLGVDVRGLRDELATLAAALDASSATGVVLSPEAHPTIPLTGDVGSWDDVAEAPTVPLVARSTWFGQGLEAYRRGEFFEAHELWEQLWRDERDEAQKQFLQGLIQIAAAMHKAIVERKPAPAARLLGRARLRLATAPADGHGLDLARLLREAARAEQALEAPSSSEGGNAVPFEASLIPTIARVLA
jgi:predicted metal-dependent hydrolase